MKKLVSTIVCVAFILLQLSHSHFLSGYAQSNNTITFSCGLNLKAYLDKSEKTLTICGTGDMDYFTEDYPPWMNYYNYINYVTIEEGVTSIESFAFFRCILEKIVIPESVEFIGDYALSMGDVKEIEIAENSKLQEFIKDDYFNNTTWYKSQPDGPVYFGNLLLCYKGKMPTNTVIKIKEGTYAINSQAFYNQQNLIDIIVPDSVKRIGTFAFLLTDWFNNMPEGEVYLGNVLYAFNIDGAMMPEDYKETLFIPEGIVSVADSAFASRCVYTEIVFPSSLEYIGEEAFYQCNRLERIVFPSDSSLKHIDRYAFQGCSNLNAPELPKSLQRIDYFAFQSCKNINKISIPLNVEFIGFNSFESCDTLSEFIVDLDNKVYCSDEFGVIYSKDKRVLIKSPLNTAIKEYTVSDTVVEIYPYAFSQSALESVKLPETVHTIGIAAFSNSKIKAINLSYGLKYIEAYTFFFCENLTEIVIPKSVVSIGYKAYGSCSAMNRIVIPSSVCYINDSAFSNCSKLTVNCYADTTAYFYCTENDIPYILLQYPDTSVLDSLIERYHILDREKYLTTSLAKLDQAVSAVNMNANEIDQELVDTWSENIITAFEDLKYLPADYYVVTVALSRAENIDRSLYTEKSLAELDKALSCVKYDIDVSNQNIVIEYARAINEAIDNLEYLPADYSKVIAAITESEKYDKRLYSQATFTALSQSIAAVEYGLNITEQNKVDIFAHNIESAISSLKFAEIVLRNEPYGVIVSASAKEIDPDTALTVDLKDSSDLQSGNFAVGGTVKSITLYDINLILNAQKSQPNGTVTVKIRLPEGVDPKRCKVYHIIDDPVDPLVRYTSSVEGNFIVFETDHFSEFAVIEVETILEKIEITTPPNKTTYTLGETVNTSGLEIIAHYSDGTSSSITNYDVSSVDTFSIGEKNVTVYHTYNGVTKSDSFKITVSNGKMSATIMCNGEELTEYNKKIPFFKSYSREAIKLDCEASGNCKIEWSSDNPKVLVDSNGNVTNKGFFFARKATITVRLTDSAGNILATDSVIVRFYKFNFQFAEIQSTFIQALKRVI